MLDDNNLRMKNKILLAVSCFLYAVFFFVLDTLGGKFIFDDPINWKGGIIQAVFFGIFMTAFDYYSRKHEWFGRKRKK